MRNLHQNQHQPVLLAVRPLFPCQNLQNIPLQLKPVEIERAMDIQLLEIVVSQPKMECIHRR